MRKSVLYGLLLVSMMALSSSYISLVGSSELLPASLVLLNAGTKWAAHNGARAAYADWRDHLVAHPSPYCSDPNASLPWQNTLMFALTQYGLTVDPVADMPVDLSSYNVVVREAYLTCGPSYEPAIRDHISNGGARA